MLDRRRSARRRTLLAGRAEVARLNGWVMDCAVRNLSDDGAKIAFDGRITIPQCFQLGISGAPPREARLIWYRDGHAGVGLAG